MLKGLEGELNQLSKPEVHITNKLIAEGAGELVAELLGARKAKGYTAKITKSWLDTQNKQQVNEITSRYYNLYSQWFRDTCTQVSCDSSDASGLIFRRIKHAESFKRLDTRMRHVISQLEELRAHKNIPVAPPQKMLSSRSVQKELEPAEVLQSLENMLRRFIETELSKGGADWWDNRIPSEVRGRAVKRKQTRELVWPWYPPTSTNVVDYLDFSDYKKIILDPANWREAFARFFGNQSFIEVKLGELEPIRNDISHSRLLSDLAIKKLVIYCAEIKQCIPSK